MSDIALPVALHSPNQLSVVVIELRRFAHSLQKYAVQTKVTGAPTALPELSNLSMAVLSANDIQQNDQKKVESLVTALEKARDKAPTAHMTLAELPDSSEQQQFAEWFRAHVHPHSLLTFSARSDIGGGMILQTGTHVYDLTFRTQLLDHKGRIAEIFGDGHK